MTFSIYPRNQSPTGNTLQVQIGPGDPISNMPVIIDYGHHQVHEGESFEFFWQGSVNGVRNFRFTVPAVTPSINAPHMVAEVISDSTLTNLYWYEGIAAWTTGGNETTDSIHNRNRNSLTTSTLRVYTSNTLPVNPTTVGGTFNFWQGLLMTGRNGTSMTTREMQEWILKSNTEYLFQIITANASNVLIRWLWYEDRGV
jgi:hypothetical protein